MAIIKSAPFDPEYARNYREAQVDKHRLWEVTAACNQILLNKDHYIPVEKALGIPWDVVACIHLRESALNFRAVLHNGERIVGTGLKTKLVPKGHGPFASWEAAAIDALLIKKYLFPKVWTIENQLKFLEAYNGLGYKRRRELSPYLWAGTTKHDETGKYVADGHYDAKAIEKQLGAVAILKMLRKD